MRRRALLAGLAALAALPGGAHTPYRQWTVYRQKHLLVGCHRGDPEGVEVTRRAVASLEAHLPEARARVARAPRPGRLAGLIGTGQLDLAVLAPEAAREMAGGQGVFAPWGPVPLATLAVLGTHHLVAAPRMPARHAWLVAEALGRSPGEPALPWHPGAAAFHAGKPPGP